MTFVDGKLHSTVDSHIGIAIAVTAGVKSTQCESLQAAMRLLAQFLYVESVYESVDVKKDFRLFVLTIDALRDGYYPDTYESQLLSDA